MPGESDTQTAGTQTTGTQGTEDPQTGPAGQGAGETPTTWEEMLATLPEEAKTLYEAHVTGLKNALTGERDQRRKLAQQVQDATAKLEQGSEAREALEKMTGEMEAAERRAQFYEDAAGQGVNNLKLAWIAANEVEAFDRRGNVNWETLKKQFPELFKQTAPATAHAGAGIASPANQPFDMDAAIRSAAGRG
jgi:hypothetical protein